MSDAPWCLGIYQSIDGVYHAALKNTLTARTFESTLLYTYRPGWRAASCQFPVVRNFEMALGKGET